MKFKSDDIVVCSKLCHDYVTLYQEYRIYVLGSTYMLIQNVNGSPFLSGDTQITVLQDCFISRAENRKRKLANVITNIKK